MIVLYTVHKIKWSTLLAPWNMETPFSAFILEIWNGTIIFLIYLFSLYLKSCTCSYNPIEFHFQAVHSLGCTTYFMMVTIFLKNATCGLFILNAPQICNFNLTHNHIHVQMKHLLLQLTEMLWKAQHSIFRIYGLRRQKSRTFQFLSKTRKTVQLLNCTKIRTYCARFIESCSSRI